MPSQIYMGHEALEQLAKVGEQIPRVQERLEFLASDQDTTKHRQPKTNGNADLSRLPLSSTAVDSSPVGGPPEPDDADVYRVGRFSTPTYVLDSSAQKRVRTWEALAPDRMMPSPWAKAHSYNRFFRSPHFGPRTNLLTPPPSIIHLTSIIHLILDSTCSRSAVRTNHLLTPPSPPLTTNPTSRAAPGGAINTAPLPP